MSRIRSASHSLRLLGLAAVLLLLYAPVAMVFIYSFNDSRIGSVWTKASARWYGEIFERGDLWASLELSVLIAFSAATGSVVAAVAAAHGLPAFSGRFQKLVRAVFLIPLLLPDVLMGISLALTYAAIGLPKSLLTVVASHLVFGVAYAFVVIQAAVEELDSTIYDAALDCGATPRQAFFQVTLPILRPSIAVAWLFVFVLSFDDFLITFFTKGVGGDTLPIKIYSQMRFGVRPDTNVLFVLVATVSLAAFLLVERFAAGSRRDVVQEPPLSRSTLGARRGEKA